MTDSPPQSELTQPELTQPELTQPELTQPELTQPELTQPAAAKPEAARRTVLGSRLCTGCGYDLRSLPLEGRCPECGQLVAQSMRRFRLRYASLHHVETVCSGATILLSLVIVNFLMICAAAFVLFLEPAAMSRTTLLILLLVQAVASTCNLVGISRYSTPDPDYPGSDAPSETREILRSLALMIAVVSATSLLIAAASLMSTLSSSTLARLSEYDFELNAVIVILQCIWCLTLVLQMVATMRYTAWIARRVPDELLEGRAPSYGWLILLTATIGMLAFLLGPLLALGIHGYVLCRLRTRLHKIASATRRRQSAA